MAQAFVMTTTEPWVEDRRDLWVVLADTPALALETARADGRNVDGVVGTLSEEVVDRERGQAGLREVEGLFQWPAVCSGVANY
jgi:hypothetical protein